MFRIVNQIKSVCWANEELGVTHADQLHHATPDVYNVCCHSCTRLDDLYGPLKMMSILTQQQACTSNQTAVPPICLAVHWLLKQLAELVCSMTVQPRMCRLDCLLASSCSAMFLGSSSSSSENSGKPACSKDCWQNNACQAMSTCF